jgi:hypothetical protein
MSVTLQAIGGTPPYTWSTIDTLPTGITLSSEGVLSGVPDSPTSGAYYTVQVTDSANATAIVDIWIQVVGVAQPIHPVAELLNRDSVVIPEVLISMQTINPTPFPVVPEIAVFSNSQFEEVLVVPEMEVIVTNAGGGS